MQRDPVRIVIKINDELVDVTSMPMYALAAKFNSKKELWNYLFEYDFGKLYWKVVISRGTAIGEAASKGLLSGYRVIRMKNSVFTEHRIIWEMFNYEITKCMEVQFIDCNKENTCIENLRLSPKVIGARAFDRVFVEKRHCTGKYSRFGSTENLNIGDISITCKNCQRRFIVPAQNNSIAIPEFIDECPHFVKYGSKVDPVTA